MKHRQQARFHAFDLVNLNGEDLRKLPLLTRKEKLRRILPSGSAHVLYVDHTKGAGQRLYELACQVDLEGIVAKRAASPYARMRMGKIGSKSKIRNYSQKRGPP